MSARVQELLQDRMGLIHQQEAILSKAKDEKRNPSGEEFEKIKNLDVAIADIEMTVEAEKTVQARLNGLDDSVRQTTFDTDVDNADKGQAGFNNFGEYLVAVAASASPRGSFQNAGQIDPRLVQNATGHSANVPSDGGFLIHSTMSDEIMQKSYSGGEISSRCTVYEVGANSDSMEVPYVDETSRANGSRWGGLRAYREGEIDAPTSTKTKLGKWECRLEDLKALVYVTERLLNDAPALQSLIMDQLPQEFTFKLEDEILNGNGANQCAGIIGDSATVSVAKETGQGAATLEYENILKMYARAWGRSRANAVWLHNQDVEPQLFAMSQGIGTAGVPVFLPPGGLSGSPYMTLFGKPLIPVEQAATLGTVGDIILADMSQYALVRKGGLNAASSVHVRFIYDEMTFKFNMRVNGKPKWKSVLTPFKGASNTLSPFITLDTRA